MGETPDCIFCRIVAGDAPATTVAGNDRALAFMDINPASSGHVLVVPRAHATDLLDVTSDDLAACAVLAQEIARRAEVRLGADGVNLLNCTGEAAWQSVFHFHIHVIPRYANDVGKDRIGLPWTSIPTSTREIEQLGARLG